MEGHLVNVADEQNKSNAYGSLSALRHTIQFTFRSSFQLPHKNMYSTSKGRSAHSSKQYCVRITR